MAEVETWTYARSRTGCAALESPAAPIVKDSEIYEVLTVPKKKVLRAGKGFLFDAGLRTFNKFDKIDAPRPWIKVEVRFA